MGGLVVTVAGFHLTTTTTAVFCCITQSGDPRTDLHQHKISQMLLPLPPFSCLRWMAKDFPDNERSMWVEVAVRKYDDNYRNSKGERICKVISTHQFCSEYLCDPWKWWRGNYNKWLVGDQSGVNGNTSTVASVFQGRYSIAYNTVGDLRRLCKSGRLNEAMHILDIMDQRGSVTNFNIYICLLRGCVNRKALAEGRLIHAHILKNDIKPNIFLENTLVNMYFKCGSVIDAQQIFDKMPERNVFTWTIMIAGYMQNSQSEKALDLFWQMEAEGLKPNKVTFVSILKACASIAALEEGKQIHARIIKSGFESDVFVGSALVDMYAKCGRIEHAQYVLSKMPKRGNVAWTAMIAAYARHGQGEKALESFRRMEYEGVKPDQVTFLTILKACASIASLEQGKKIHVYIVRSGFESDIFVGNALIDMYTKCGSIEYARNVFDRMPKRDVVSWNVMISGYVQQDQSEKALNLFHEMKQVNVQPDRLTFVSILKACTRLASLEQGKEIHAYSVENGLQFDAFVGSTLVDMYAKCGSIEHARRVFDEMPKCGAVAWNVMITGYVQHGKGKEALKLFQLMEQKGVKPDKVTFMTILKACAMLAALEQGKQIHNHVVNNGLESDVFVGSTLVDMYAKSGSIENACQVFQQMPRRDVATWNAMLAGYAQHGLGSKAIQLVEQMCREGITPDDITFTCLLSACSHAALVDEGFDYFVSMARDHGIIPTNKHYACMVDLIGRAGHLEEAEDLVKTMPIQPSSVVWTALLGACRNYGDLELAKCSADSILELDPQHVASFVLLSNIYASVGRTDKKARLRKLLEDKIVNENPGYSHVELNNQVHAFTMEDFTHPDTKEMHSELKRLFGQMEEVGYVPDTRFVPHAADEKQKGFSLCSHSEKLAIIFGLINMPPGTPVRIVKNLPVCGDCHNATKFISKVVQRGIIIRDPNRFHHFKDGRCSCGDH